MTAGKQPGAPQPAPGAARPTAAFSVVIPAHQEERTIGRCLEALAPLVETGSVEVVVVVNGSTDGTARTARAHTGVRVLETPVPSKAHALNLGDTAVTTFPRVYLDADVLVAPAGLQRLAAVLDGPEPRVGSVALDVDLTDCSWPVRYFYDIFLRLPYARAQLIGLGLYAFSRAGRSRFTTFPDHTADDLFVDRLFTSAERVVLADHRFTVKAPRSTSSLLAVRTRVHFGNDELADAAPADERFASSASGSARALAAVVVEEPRLLPRALVYIAITLVARRRASVRRRSGRRIWDRDESTH